MPKLPVFAAGASLVLAVAVASPIVHAAPRPAPSRRDSLPPLALAARASSDLSDAAAPLRSPGITPKLLFVGAAGQTLCEPPRIGRAPVIDGALDDAAWAEAAVLDSFTHSRPVEGVRDTLGTVAMVMYDDANLYVAFRAKDDPSQVRAPIVPRDQIGQGDWVGVSLDTYDDQQRSFFLCASPLGIQMDGVDQEGRDSDMAPDFQYRSRGRLTADGYEVEFAIPFRTLRFPPRERVRFGFQAIRDIRRSGAHLYWAPVSRNVNSYHSQIGKLAGLTGIAPGRNLEVNPTFTTTTLAERAPSRLDWNEPVGRFGLGAKLGLTSNLIADVAMTPDFSQVEADAGVANINERFAIFFDEKRPFFLEGSDIFTTPTNLLYTRRIVDPLYGAKLTGKVGRTAIGVLNAADRSAGRGVDGLPDRVNPYADHDAQFTIARVKRDVFSNSYVGLLAGDRTFEDQYNRGAAVDGRLRWADRYSLSFIGAHSWQRDQDYRGALAALTPAEQATAPAGLSDLEGDQRQGDHYSVEVGRDTRALNAGVGTFGFSPAFAADMGFIQRTDLRGASTWIRPHLWGKPGQWFTAVHFPIYAERDWSWDGRTPVEDVISLSQEIDLPRNEYVGMENVRRFVRHNGVDFYNLYRHAVWAGSSRLRSFQPSALYVWGDQVVFAETQRGHDRRWEVEAAFRFGSQFDGSVQLNGSTVWRGSGDSRFAEAFIPRVRLSYQFSRELSVRWITELQSRRFYDANGVELERTQVLTPDVLVSYYVRPGTVLYVGYGSVLDGRATDDLRPARSSVFTKFSYLWQL